jgi:hypothetical protein
VPSIATSRQLQVRPGGERGPLLPAGAHPRRRTYDARGVSSMKTPFHTDGGRAIDSVHIGGVRAARFADSHPVFELASCRACKELWGALF